MFSHGGRACKLQQADVVIDGPVIIVFMEDDSIDSNVLLVRIWIVQVVASNSYSNSVSSLSGILSCYTSLTSLHSKLPVAN